MCEAHSETTMGAISTAPEGGLSSDYCRWQPNTRSLSLQWVQANRQTRNYRRTHNSILI